MIVVGKSRYTRAPSTKASRIRNGPRITMNSSHGWRDSSPMKTLAGAVVRIGVLSTLHQSGEDLVERGLTGSRRLDVATALLERSHQLRRGARAILHDQPHVPWLHVVDTHDPR